MSPTPLQVPSVTDALARALRLQGKVTFALGGEVIPTLDVGHFVQPPVRRHATAAFSVAAGGAGTFAALRLITVEGTLLVPRRLTSFSGSIVVLLGEFGASVGSNYGSGATPSFTDGRAGGAPAGVLEFDTPPALVTTPILRTISPAVSATSALPIVYDFPEGWVLTADVNPMLDLQVDTANVSLQGTLEWDEYQVF